MNLDYYIPNLICFTGTAEHCERAYNELKRVGFKKINVCWSFPNPFDRALLNTMPHTRMFDDNIGFFNCSRMHYRIIKTAYELERKYVFICEDDCRFRKDIRNLADIVRHAPEADVLLLDAIPPKNGLLTPLEPIADGWSSFKSMRSGACYVLSREAMARIIWLYESAINPKVRNRLARICDQWFESKYLSGLRLVMATPNLAVQQSIPGHHNSGNVWRLAGYQTLGIDLNNYAEY